MNSIASSSLASSLSIIILLVAILFIAVIIIVDEVYLLFLPDELDLLFLLGLRLFLLRLQDRFLSFLGKDRVGCGAAL